MFDFRRPNSAPLALFFVAILLSSTLLAGSVGSWGIEAVREAAQESHYASSARGCAETDFLADKRCWWWADAPGAPIYVLGDSTANMLSDGLVLVAQQLDRPLALAGLGGCPAFAVGGESDVCLDFRQKNRIWVLGQIPGTVMLTFSDFYFVDYGALDRSVVNFDSLRNVVSELVTAGHAVVVILPSPRFVGPDYLFDPKSCSTWAWVSNSCRAEAPRAFFSSAQRPSRAAILSALADFDAVIINLDNDICTVSVCGSHAGDRLVYVDTTHFSRSTSIALAETLAESLQ